MPVGKERAKSVLLILAWAIGGAVCLAVGGLMLYGVLVLFFRVVLGIDLSVG